MPLSRATVPITFTGGLDQKRPAKLSIPGRFLNLVNCIRRKYGQIEKRFGFASLGNTITGTSDTIPEGKGLATFRDDVVLFSSNRIFSYASAADTWIDKGDIVNALLTTTAIVRNGGIQAMADIATNQGLTASVWEDSTGGIRCAVHDDTTGAAILDSALISSTGTRPKVYAVSTFFIFAYGEGTNFRTRRIAISLPTTIEAAQTVQGGIWADKPWDVAVYGDVAIFAFNNTASGITVGYIATSGAVGSAVGNALPSPVTIASGTALGSDCLTITINELAGLFYIFYHDAATSINLTVKTYTSDLIGTATATVEALALVRNVTATVRSDSSLIVFYEVSAAATRNHYVRSNTVSWPGSGAITVGAPADFKRSVGLASKAWAVGTDEFVTVVHESNAQPTYFVVRDDGFISTKIAPFIAGGLTRDTARTLKSGLTCVSLNQAGSYVGAVQIRTELDTEIGGTILATQIGINAFALDFSSFSYRDATLGENMHIAGGIVLAYDGTSAFEHGFNLYPEGIAFSSAAGGSLTAGTYSFRVVYEWVDARGQIHRSAPSITASQLVTANRKIPLIIPTLRLTAKDTLINCVVYVAAKDLSVVYYRHGVVANSTTADTVTYEITTEAVTTNEVLYTTGGVLENIAAPSCTAIHEHLNRLFIAGLEDGTVGYSKQFVTTEGVAFSDLFRINMEAAGGPVTALAGLDDKEIIFKRDRLYYLSGDGPLDSGAQNDYSRPLPIATDVGTSNPASIAETPQGVFFQSAKGIYVLTRALTTQYVGEGVEDFNNLTITSTTVMADENEVRFTTSDGPTLVYNYFLKQWSTFENYEAIDACNGLDTYLHLKSDGTVNKELPNVYEDNGTKFAMAIETSWLSLSGLQGFQRIYNLLFLGDFVSHHFTKLKVAYDFEEAYTETVYFDTRTGLVSSNVYGAGSPYGSDDPYGGEGSDVYQFRFQPARQKCESVKCRLEDIDTINSGGGGSFKLVALTAEIGRKQGAYKLPTRKTIGNG